MRIHFIAIGGAVMHNLAIALHNKGYQVTGSDDEIFEPSRLRLEKYRLLPDKPGWDISRITPDIDLILLGMHARPDNPELQHARNTGLKIVSFPEYLYEQTKNKKRIVVAGSHGKTTTTAMIMHVLRFNGIRFDYMVGSAVEGYETMVGLSDDSRIAVFEGDEYLTSPVDRRPKFHLYRPDTAIITGIAWDHMNVFPTFDNYKDQFRIFIDTITAGGKLVYNTEDPELKQIAEAAKGDIVKIPYNTHGYFQNRTGFYAATHSRTVPLRIFGEHNMQNLSAAREACLSAGLTEDQFYNAIPTFEGTARRLQKLGESDSSVVFLDFAHAPSKVKATLQAVIDRYPGKEVIACLELHTFSSLNTAFLPNYAGSLDSAGKAFVYFNPHAVAAKKLKPVTKEEMASFFGEGRVKVFNDSEALINQLMQEKKPGRVFLLMSSGDFDGCNMQKLAEDLLD